jgi:hypothetical protein
VRAARALLPPAGALLALGAATALAQRRAPSTDDATFTVHNVPYDGRFTFLRLRFTPYSYRGGGGGYFGGVNYQWDHDYPRADRHFTTLVRELTAVSPGPGTNILSMGSPDLMRYPFAYVSEPGWWSMSEGEAANLRSYLLKGGFLIFDDFTGTGALANLELQLSRVIPGARLLPLDVSHPIFHSFFEIESLDFTHPYADVTSVFLGLFEDNDPDGRLLAVANYNNDLGESWEWSDTGLIPVELTNQAYKLGINYLVYAMTH